MKKNLAYIAGLFDGEGCVVIRKDRKYFRLEVRITNTNRKVIDYIHSFFNGDVIVYDKGRYKTCYNLRFADGKGAKFLKSVLPYLIIKKEQAKLGIEFQEKVIRKIRNKCLTKRDLTLRKKYKEKISKLNNK